MVRICELNWTRSDPIATVLSDMSVLCLCEQVACNRRLAGPPPSACVLEVSVKGVKINVEDQCHSAHRVCATSHPLTFPPSCTLSCDRKLFCIWMCSASKWGWAVTTSYSLGVMVSLCQLGSIVQDLIRLSGCTHLDKHWWLQLSRQSVSPSPCVQVSSGKIMYPQLPPNGLMYQWCVNACE